MAFGIFSWSSFSKAVGDSRATGPDAQVIPLGETTVRPERRPTTARATNAEFQGRLSDAYEPSSPTGSGLMPRPAAKPTRPVYRPAKPPAVHLLQGATRGLATQQESAPNRF